MYFFNVGEERNKLFLAVVQVYEGVGMCNHVAQLHLA